MATHASIPTCKIPRTEEPGGLQSMGCREMDATEHACTHTGTKYMSLSRDLVYEQVKCNHSVVSDSLRPHGLTIAYQVPLSMGFTRQEYWSGLPFPSPGDLPDPGIKPGSPAL